MWKLQLEDRLLNSCQMPKPTDPLQPGSLQPDRAELSRGSVQSIIVAVQSLTIS